MTDLISCWLVLLWLYGLVLGVVFLPFPPCGLGITFFLRLAISFLNGLIILRIGSVAGAVIVVTLFTIDVVICLELTLVFPANSFNTVTPL